MMHVSNRSERDSRLRSLFKAITYRVIGTVTTTVIVFAVTDELMIAFTVGFIEPIAKTLIYYVHERAWELVPHRVFTRRQS